MREKPVNMIYIGPTIPTLGLKQNTLYRGEMLPSTLIEIALNKPVVRSLFIKTSELAVALKNLENKGSLEHTANQELKALAKKLPR